MNITISENAGFCPGVRRADKEIQELIARNDGKIFTLGHLIHNRLYNEELDAKGVRSIDIDELKSMLRENRSEPITLVIRTHGVTKEISEELATLSRLYTNLTVTDMTCPYVKRIHKIAEESTSSDTVFLLYCDEKHPEAIGIMSYAKGEKHAFSSEEALLSLEIKDKIPILCSQTTQNLLEFQKIKKIFKKLYTNAIFFDTICNVTENRQNDAVKLAKNSDIMIVIGGKESSNTHKLFDLCSDVCPATLWIESARDLTDFPDNAKSVGIAAGASTPDGIITEVLDLWKKKT